VGKSKSSKRPLISPGLDYILFESYLTMSEEGPVPVEATKKRKRTGKEREERKKAAIQVGSFSKLRRTELTMTGEARC
jgi:hypothetical protein